MPNGTATPWGPTPPGEAAAPPEAAAVSLGIVLILAVAGTFAGLFAAGTGYVTGLRDVTALAGVLAGAALALLGALSAAATGR